MEGGPVFGEHGLLIGVLTRPLKQRISGAEIQVTWECYTLSSCIESPCATKSIVETY